VIITDLYVDPEQVVFFRSQDGWMVKVVGKTNPTLLNGGDIEDAGSKISSGDRVTVGRTNLRVYASDHAVEPTHQMMLSSWLGHGRSHSLFASLMMVFALAAVMFISYQERTTKLDWNPLFLEALYAGLVVLFWAGIWALIGRLLRHQPNFTAQLGFTALVTGIVALVTPLGGYMEYAANSLLVGDISSRLIMLLTMTAMFRANLMFATNLKRYTRIAFIASMGILLISYATMKFGKDEFDYQPEYSAVLRPPFAHLSADSDVHDFQDAFKQGFDEVDLLAREK
jgi:hypothetical protein